MKNNDRYLPENDIEDVLGFAVENGAGFAELFFESRKTFSAILEDSRAEKITSGRDGGFGLRVVSAGLTAYGYSNATDRKEMMKICRGLLEEIERGGDAAGDSISSGKVSESKPSGNETSGGCGDVPAGDKVELIFSADRAARSVSDEIVQVRAGYGDSRQDVWIYNSEGLAVSDRRRQLVFNVRAVASDGAVLQTAFRSAGGSVGFEFLSGELVERLALEAAESAVRILHASPVEGRTMTVVLGSEAGGTMIHEAIGHGLEGDAVCREQSVYSGKVGRPVASELVTVIDDATLRGKRGSYRFDDEGTPAGRTVLVENGILKGYMNDRASASRLGRSSTGNARRQSFRFRPIVRMSNTMIGPGRQKPDSILSSVDDGLYVARMGGGQVDTSSGDFVFKVNEGYRIRKGKVAEPVRGATLIGNGPRVLEKIDMIGTDLGFSIGTCGKDGQHVPVADAQPTLRIPAITVGGEARGM